MGNLQKAHRLAEIHTLIKTKMEELDLTKEQLAQLFDQPAKAMHNILFWVQGRGAPGPRYLNKLAEIFNVDPDDLSLTPQSKELTVIPAQEKTLTVIPPPQENVKQVTFTVSGDFDGEISISFRKDRR